MKKDYVKIVYESEPIGEYKIRLILTTFDVEAYMKDINNIKYDKELIEIPVEPPVSIEKRIETEHYLGDLEQKINSALRRIYEPEINSLKTMVQMMKDDYENNLKDAILNPIKEIMNVSGDIHCRDVNGHITNCGDIYCNTFKGVANNCGDIIVKRNEEDIVSL